MANIGDGGGGRTGPYWRRRLGMTLPNEMTGPQLQRINLARRAQGLPPVGGRVGFDTPQQATEGAGPGGNPAGAAGPRPIPRPNVGQQPLDLVHQYRAILGAAQGEVDPSGGGSPLQPDGVMQPGGMMRPGPQEEVDPGFNLGGPGGGGHSVANLRDLLLRRLTGAAPQLTSSAALNHVRGRAVGRRGARPILPQRKGLPAAGRQLPY